MRTKIQTKVAVCIAEPPTGGSLCDFDSNCWYEASIPHFLTYWGGYHRFRIIGDFIERLKGKLESEEFFFDFLDINTNNSIRLILLFESEKIEFSIRISFPGCFKDFYEYKSVYESFSYEIINDAMINWLISWLHSTLEAWEKEFPKHVAQNSYQTKTPPE